MGDYYTARKFIFNVFKVKHNSSFSYHSLIHTKEVIFFVTKLAIMENIEKKDILLLKTAALYHDIGLLFSFDEHEQYSAEFARKTLEKFNFTFEEIKIITKLILATKVPQNPNGILQEIICDADLMNLGKENFFRKNRLLRKELENQSQFFSEKKWVKKTNEFLSKHNFFTKSASQLLENQKEENKTYTKRYLKLLDIRVN